jgi:hypothetical protein
MKALETDRLTCYKWSESWLHYTKTNFPEPDECPVVKIGPPFLWVFVRMNHVFVHEWLNIGGADSRSCEMISGSRGTRTGNKQCFT